MGDQGKSNLIFATKDNGKSAKGRPIYTKYMYQRGGNWGQRPYDMFLDTTGSLVLNNGTTVGRGTRGRVFLQPIDPDGKVATFTQASVAGTIMAGKSSSKPPRLLATAALTTGTAPMPRTRKEVLTQTSTVAPSEDKQTWTFQS